MLLLVAPTPTASIQMAEANINQASIPKSKPNNIVPTTYIASIDSVAV